MKRTKIFFLAVMASMVCHCADPYVGYIYPSGIKAGTTNRFIVGGQGMWRLRGLHFNCGGLRVLDIKQVPRFVPPTGMQSKHLKNWLDRIAKGIRGEPVKPEDPHMSEWRSNSWWSVLGSLGPLEISIVERYLYTPRNSLQDAPSLRQMNIVTIAADANATPGTYSFSAWSESGISAPRSFMVTAADRVAEPLFVPKHRGASKCSYADATLDGVVLDGQIMPGEIDKFRLRLSGGRRYSVKVVARELQPYIGDAVPGFFNPIVMVRDMKGRVVGTADDDARFRPDPSFDFKSPAPAVYVLDIHDVLYRGRADFVYSIEVAPYELPPKRCAKAKEAKDGVQYFSGTVAKPGEKSVCEFAVKEPGRRIFEVSARKNGSSIDAVMTLKKLSCDEPLMQWDDTTNKVFVGTIPQSECDPVGEYDFKEPGRYVMEIADRTGRGGDEYFWDLKIRPPIPDFKVYSARSTLPLYRGSSLKVDFVIVRQDGFDGKVTLEFPKDVKTYNNVATSGVDRISTTARYVGRKTLEIQPISVLARGKVNGKTVSRKVVPCDEYEQAFAWRHLVPAESFIMRATPGKLPPKKKATKKQKALGKK
jgi:hypothetical protein